MRRAGATYEEIAKAGGGIASTVAQTAAASRRRAARAEPPPPARADARRLHDGRDQVGLRPRSARASCGCSRSPAQLGEGEAVRIVPTLLALHALPADQRDRRAHYVSEIVDKLIPAAAKAGLATSVDAFCDTIAFTPDEVERLFKAAAHHGLRVRLHAEQLSNQHGAALAAQYRALSADHLEHLDEAGAKAMAAAGTVAVLLPGAFYALQEKQKPPVAAAAQAQGADRRRHRLQPRHLAVAVADAGDEHGLHLVRPDARGGARRDDHQRRARARPCA